MLLREVAYAKPSSVAEALEILAADDGARALAGGQTLINVMKARAGSPDTLVDLNGLDDLKGIELGGTVVTPREADRRGALICIRSTDAPALVAALGGDGIVTSERDSNLRVSAHAYNTEDDIDAVLAGLARHRHLLT